MIAGIQDLAIALCQTNGRNIKRFAADKSWLIILSDSQLKIKQMSTTVFGHQKQERALQK